GDARYTRTSSDGNYRSLSFYVKGTGGFKHMAKDRHYPIWRAAAAAALIGGLSLQVAPHATLARSAHAGTTLIVDYKTDISHLDTGKCYDTECYPFVHVMYDQLVGYDITHGNGDTLIPDAAAAMPAITNGGK